MLSKLLNRSTFRKAATVFGFHSTSAPTFVVIVSCRRINGRVGLRFRQGNLRRTAESAVNSLVGERQGDGGTSIGDGGFMFSCSSCIPFADRVSRIAPEPGF